MAQTVVIELKNAGFEAWWDQDLRGQDLASEVLRRINAADVVLILVSRNWLASDWCKGEGEAAGCKRRIVVLEEDLMNVLPPPFRARNVLDLAGFHGRRNDPRLAKVIEACALSDCAAQGPSVLSPNREKCSSQSRAGAGTDGYIKKTQIVNIHGDNTGTINFNQDN